LKEAFCGFANHDEVGNIFSIYDNTICFEPKTKSIDFSKGDQMRIKCKKKRE
jgi:hypothetical protein